MLGGRSNVLKKNSLFRFRNFAMLKKQQKQHLLKLTKPSELNNFANMVAKIDIDALKI